MEVVPYETSIVVPFREKDEQFIKIQDLIDAKRKLLIDKQKKLRFISKQNRFLEAVRSDYVKYNDYVLEQKRNQIKALQLLEDYINDLKISGKLTKNNIEDAKEEQAKILREVKSIKNSLDSIISETEGVHGSLDKKKYSL